MIQPTDDTAASQPVLLDVKDLKTHFPVRSGLLQRTTGYVKAVDGVSFHVKRGETAVSSVGWIMRPS